MLFKSSSFPGSTKSQNEEMGSDRGLNEDEGLGRGWIKWNQEVKLVFENEPRNG